MNAIEKTACLINGTRGIDRMRSEVIQVVKTITDFAPSLNDNSEFHVKEFNTSECTWRVKVQFECLGRDTYKPPFIVECWPKEGQIVFCSTRPQHLQLENVQFVHRVLPVFVGGMIKSFPNLEKLIQPLLDAAPMGELKN